MTADELAQALAEFYAETAEPLVAFDVEKPADVGVVDGEHETCQVFCVAKDEREEPVGDRGYTCKRVRVVSVAVNGRLDDERTLGKYLQLAEQLRTLLEGTEFGRYLWDGNETIVLWDAEAVRTRKRFLSLFEATYYEFS